MTREDYILAFKSIHDTLSHHKVITILTSQLRRSPNSTKDLKSPQVIKRIMRLYSDLDSYLANADDTSVELVKLMGLEPIFSLEFWVGTFQIQDENSDRSVRAEYFEVLNLMSMFLEQGPNLIKPLMRTSSENIDQSKDDYSIEDEKIFQEKILKNPTETFVFPDSGKGFLVKDVADRLSSLEKTYQLICKILELDTDKLFVEYIESGSPVEIKIRGNGESMQALRGLISDIFNFLVFKSEMKESAKNDVLIQNLELIKKINSDEKSGKITSEQADLYRHQLNLQVNSLADYTVVSKRTMLGRKKEVLKIESKSRRLIAGPNKVNE